MNCVVILVVWFTLVSTSLSRQVGEDRLLLVVRANDAAVLFCAWQFSFRTFDPLAVGGCILIDLEARTESFASKGSEARAVTVSFN